MKLVKNNSFMVTLMLMMAAATFYFIFAGESRTDYESIHVTRGDSLWSLAEKYEPYHQMPFIDFIEWVQEENNLITTKIVPGEKLVIPVPANKHDISLQLADGE